MAAENPEAQPQVENPPPARGWDDLIGELNLSPYELAYQLHREHGALDLTSQPSAFTNLITPSNTNSAQALLLLQSSSETRAFTLIALQDRVAVLYDLKELIELNPQGGRYAGLVGDLRKVAGQTIFPDMCHQPELTSRTAHRAVFAAREIRTQDWNSPS